MDFTDQLGRNIVLEKIPERIVSVVPSQTELIADLGLEHRIVGRTVFCVHPQNTFKSAYKIGGTKKLQLHKIRALKPDLIVANKEENDQEQIETLAAEFPVWISDIYNVNDALNMVTSIGQMLDVEAKANELVSEIQSAFVSLQSNKKIANKKVLYLIWREPYMAAGKRTFINAMLHEAGFNNAIAEPDSRYPELSVDGIQSLKPDMVFLSSEPYPFATKHLEELKLSCPGVDVKLVDGEMFSW
ncbi:MAG: ABC transporter substrate-binding protein, partial [Bacteroidia bacterium]|nr:ABC transporter substrate-binding protein [Bacteroidia bacterium]